ncbi:MAG: hypothetical protein ACKVZJ_09545 [Phycisphaerales bacterium]
MNDPRLEQLLRAAREAEAFEADVLSGVAQSGRRTPGLRLTDAGPEEREALLRSMQPAVEPSKFRFNIRGVGWRAGLAAAACLTFGWFLSSSITQPPAPTSTPSAPLASADSSHTPAANTPAANTPAANTPTRFRPTLDLLRSRNAEPTISLVSFGPSADPDDDQVGCVVVAVFRDSTGGCPCIHIQPHTIADGRSVEELTPDEIAAIRLKGSCTSTGDSLFLMAMEGPGYLLPHTAAQAEALADCVGDAPRYCDGSPGCVASMAAGCIDPSVKVVTHTVQMASR